MLPVEAMEVLVVATMAMSPPLEQATQARTVVKLALSLAAMAEMVAMAVPLAVSLLIVELYLREAAASSNSNIVWLCQHCSHLFCCHVLLLESKQCCDPRRVSCSCKHQACLSSQVPGMCVRCL